MLGEVAEAMSADAGGRLSEGYRPSDAGSLGGAARLRPGSCPLNKSTALPTMPQRARNIWRCDNPSSFLQTKRASDGS